MPISRHEYICHMILVLIDRTLCTSICVQCTYHIWYQYVLERDINIYRASQLWCILRVCTKRCSVFVRTNAWWVRLCQTSGNRGSYRVGYALYLQRCHKPFPQAGESFPPNQKQQRQNLVQSNTRCVQRYVSTPRQAAQAADPQE